MYTYSQKQTFPVGGGNYVIRYPDGAIIAEDMNNGDWQRYVDWFNATIRANAGDVSTKVTVTVKGG